MTESLGSRPRSCPSCRSIGRPDRGCQDLWHVATPTLDAFAQIGRNLRDATSNLFPRPTWMTEMVERRLAEQRRLEEAEALNRERKANDPAHQERVAALARQVGGRHYKDLAIQPVEYIMANNLPWLEGTVIKHVTRWRLKGGVDDLHKAIHYLQILIEHEEGQTDDD